MNLYIKIKKNKYVRKSGRNVGRPLCVKGKTESFQYISNITKLFAIPLKSQFGYILSFIMGLNESFIYLKGVKHKTYFRRPTTSEEYV